MPGVGPRSRSQPPGPRGNDKPRAPKSRPRLAHRTAVLVPVERSRRAPTPPAGLPTHVPPLPARAHVPGHAALPVVLTATQHASSVEADRENVLGDARKGVRERAGECSCDPSVPHGARFRAPPEPLRGRGSAPTAAAATPSPRCNPAPRPLTQLRPHAATCEDGCDRRTSHAGTPQRQGQQHW